MGLHEALEIHVAASQDDIAPPLLLVVANRASRGKGQEGTRRSRATNASPSCKGRSSSVPANSWLQPNHKGAPCRAASVPASRRSSASSGAFFRRSRRASA